MRKLIKKLLVHYRKHYEFLANNDITNKEASEYINDNHIWYGISYYIFYGLHIKAGPHLRWINSYNAPNSIFLVYYSLSMFY